MAIVDARAASSADQQHHLRIRQRITSGSARWAVATQSLMVLALLALFVFFFVQDLEPPYSTAMVGLLGVFAATRLLAVSNLSFTFSDAGLEIYTSVQHHWLGWREVTAIGEWEIRRQNALSMLLGGRQPFRVLRVHRRFRPPITVRASRGLRPDDLEILRTLALRNGVEWFVGEDFTTNARERGIWGIRTRS